MGEQGSSAGAGTTWSAPSDEDETVLDLSTPRPSIDLTSARAAQRYSDWAERLRAKRRRDQAHIRGTDIPDPVAPSHWGSDTLIGGSTSNDTGPAPFAPDWSDTTRWLGVLGLGPGATSEQVGLAFRNLAKVHHPDRWAEAEAEVQEHHSEEMLRLNAAYQALRAALPGLTASRSD